MYLVTPSLLYVLSGDTVALFIAHYSLVFFIYSLNFLVLFNIHIYRLYFELFNFIRQVRQGSYLSDELRHHVGHFFVDSLEQLTLIVLNLLDLCLVLCDLLLVLPYFIFDFVVIALNLK